jgi:hypothetical protein
MIQADETRRVDPYRENSNTDRGPDFKFVQEPDAVALLPVPPQI